MSPDPPRCATPEFVWCGGNFWSACVHCRRLAWEHEQADPLADMRNAIRGLSGPDYPPVMRRVPY